MLSSTNHMVLMMKRDCVTAMRALQLCSVPLDVSYSLQTLCTALSESAYTARSLQNSRRLLALYLAGSTKLPDDGNLLMF